MQVKEKHPWEILRDFLEQDDSTGLNDYLSALTGEESLRAVMRPDPAVASGPILATITDMCGFFLLLGAASLLLPLLSAQ